MERYNEHQERVLRRMQDQQRGRMRERGRGRRDGRSEGNGGDTAVQYGQTSGGGAPTGDHHGPRSRRQEHHRRRHRHAETFLSSPTAGLVTGGGNHDSRSSTRRRRSYTLEGPVQISSSSYLPRVNRGRYRSHRGARLGFDFDSDTNDSHPDANGVEGDSENDDVATGAVDYAVDEEERRAWGEDANDDRGDNGIEDEHFNFPALESDQQQDMASLSMRGGGEMIGEGADGASRRVTPPPSANPHADSGPNWRVEALTLEVNDLRRHVARLSYYMDRTDTPSPFPSPPVPTPLHGGSRGSGVARARDLSGRSASSGFGANAGLRQSGSRMMQPEHLVTEDSGYEDAAWRPTGGDVPSRGRRWNDNGWREGGWTTGVSGSGPRGEGRGERERMRDEVDDILPLDNSLPRWNRSNSYGDRDQRGGRGLPRRNSVATPPPNLRPDSAIDWENSEHLHPLIYHIEGSGRGNPASRRDPSPIPGRHTPAPSTTGNGNGNGDDIGLWGNILEQLEELRRTVDTVGNSPRLADRATWLRDMIDNVTEEVHSEVGEGIRWSSRGRANVEEGDTGSSRRRRRHSLQRAPQGTPLPSELGQEQRQEEHRSGQEQEQGETDDQRHGDGERENFTQVYSASPSRAIQSQGRGDMGRDRGGRWGRGEGGVGESASRGQEQYQRGVPARDDTADERDDAEDEPRSTVSRRSQGLSGARRGNGRNASMTSADSANRRSPTLAAASRINNHNDDNNPTYISGDDGGGGISQNISPNVSRSVTPEGPHRNGHGGESMSSRRYQPPRPSSSIGGELPSFMAAAVASHVPVDVERMARGQRPLPRRPATPEPVNSRRGETPPPGGSRGRSGIRGSQPRGGSGGGGSSGGGHMSEASLTGIQQSVSDLMVGLNISGTPAPMGPMGGDGGSSGRGLSRPSTRWSGGWSENTGRFSEAGPRVSNVGNIEGSVEGGGDGAGDGNNDAGAVASNELNNLLSERPGFTELVAGVLASLRTLPTEELRHTCFAVLTGSPRGTGVSPGRQQSPVLRGALDDRTDGLGLNDDGSDDRDRAATAAVAAAMMMASGRQVQHSHQSRGRRGSLGMGGHDNFGGIWERTMISPVAESPRSDQFAPVPLGHRSRRISCEVDPNNGQGGDRSSGIAVGSPLGDDSEDHGDTDAEELGSEFDYPDVFGAEHGDSQSPPITLQPPPPPHARPWSGSQQEWLPQQGGQAHQEDQGSGGGDEPPDLVGEPWDGEGVSGGVIRVGGEQDVVGDEDNNGDNENGNENEILEQVDADDFFMIGDPNQRRQEGRRVRPGRQDGEIVGYAEAEGMLFGYDCDGNNTVDGNGDALSTVLPATATANGHSNVETIRSYSRGPQGRYEVTEPVETEALAALLSHTGARPRTVQSGQVMTRDEFSQGLQDLIGLTDLPQDFMTIPPSPQAQPRTLNSDVAASRGGFGSFDSLQRVDDGENEGVGMDNVGGVGGGGIDPLDREDDGYTPGGYPLPDMDEIRALVQSNAASEESVLAAAPRTVRVAAPPTGMSSDVLLSSSSRGPGSGAGMGIDARINFKAPPQTLLPGGLCVDSKRMEQLFEAEQARQGDALVSGQEIYLRQVPGSSPRISPSRAGQNPIGSNLDTDDESRDGLEATKTSPPIFGMDAVDAPGCDDSAPPPSADDFDHGCGDVVGSPTRRAMGLPLNTTAERLPFSEGLNAELMEALSAVVAGSRNTGQMMEALVAAEAAAQAVAQVDVALRNGNDDSNNHDESCRRRRNNVNRNSPRNNRNATMITYSNDSSSGVASGTSPSSSSSLPRGCRNSGTQGVGGGSHSNGDSNNSDADFITFSPQK